MCTIYLYILVNYESDYSVGDKMDSASHFSEDDYRQAPQRHVE